ncbi:MAG: DUF3536 domain-containing protein [Anaerolineaceae bacterium]|nr:DUF3536 domain-containing protein [Anaerolineaceae bacterium]
MIQNLAFCIHGHFYQPPREDPKTGEIPIEPGAFPFQNWNERINNHCYQPNSKLGNFEYISFNIGPTLCDWLVQNDPGTMARIVEQDRTNKKNYGVGSAMAQPYNHTILPLAKREDKVTQIQWGIEDFIYYFGHKPQGMWLPETAVDLETLEVLTENEINFTILAPWQADASALNHRKPYRVELENQKEISVFFYDSGISSNVSFSPNLTVDADQFIPNTIMPRFLSNSKESQIVMFASDGELYGHHQIYRDKFLSRLIHNAHYDSKIKITYPSLWLTENPAVETINIVENSSWSCHHGVARWSDSCGCTPHPEWKKPLRNAMNQLGDKLDGIFLEVFSKYTRHAMKIRNMYIHIIHNTISIQDLFSTFIEKNLTTSETEQLTLLLEAQFERQRMFTSCGWFFDDFDRIEPRNNLAYAAHASWLTYKATGIDLVPDAISLLENVQSWRSGLKASTVFTHRIQQELIKIEQISQAY